ncbi:MAG: response regulator [Ignavibacteriaceae bacterium]|nr:response regulator [Ignavibacteriaceae bacterium]
MLFDLFSNENFLLSGKTYNKLKRKTEDFLITPIKVMSLLIAISGLFAMMFEVRYFAQFSFEVYITRLLATIVAFTVLVTANGRIGRQKPVILVHILLITIIISSAYMIYLIPSTLVTNSQIVGLMIFTSALFLSWEVKNQIIVAIYYNLVFAFAIIVNDSSIYFLPNMYESVVFVLFLSILSVIGSAVNFKLRLQAAKNAVQVLASERRFRSIFNNSAEGIFQSTIEGKFIVTNPAMAKILGYSEPSELLKIDIEKDLFKNPNERKKLIELLLDKGSVEDYQLTLKKKNGEDLIVKLNDRLITDEETGKSYLEGSIRDITQHVITEEKKKVAEKQLREEKIRADMLADEAMQQSLAKSQFLAYLGHEIRTPINGILGYLSLIDSDYYESKEELKQFIWNSKNSAETLLELLNSILDLTKIESGRMELYEVDFNLGDLIDQAITVNLSRIREKGLYVSKEIDSKIPKILHGDATRIKQIFVNLISNAIKFTEKGKVEIYSRLESISENSIVILSSVRDTGMGIPKEKLSSLFKPFSQTDVSHSSKYGGTGLGLMICKEFVNMMGGKIEVDSQVNVGSTFHFTLKLVPKKIEVPVLENSAAENEFNLKKYDTETKTPYDDDVIIKRKAYDILIAEDNVVNQKILLRILAELGYNSDAANNGKEAIEMLNKKPYHAILMDVQMPEMDGFTATQQIRKLDNQKKNTPIIAITAHALKGDREKCLDAGMNDYITKPIQANQLAKILDSWINIEVGLKEKQPVEVKQVDGIFNQQRFNEMSLGDVIFQRELLMDYFEDLELRMNRLDDYIAKHELEKVVKEIHTIKGSSFSIGATRIGEEALGIELSGKNSDWESLIHRMSTLKSAIEQTKEVVKHLL